MVVGPPRGHRSSHPPSPSRRPLEPRINCHRPPHVRSDRLILAAPILTVVAVIVAIGAVALLIAERTRKRTANGGDQTARRDDREADRRCHGAALNAAGLHPAARGVRGGSAPRRRTLPGAGGQLDDRRLPGRSGPTVDVPQPRLGNGHRAITGGERFSARDRLDGRGRRGRVRRCAACAPGRPAVTRRAGGPRAMCRRQRALARATGDPDARPRWRRRRGERHAERRHIARVRRGRAAPTADALPTHRGKLERHHRAHLAARGPVHVREPVDRARARLRAGRDSRHRVVDAARRRRS